MIHHREVRNNSQIVQHKQRRNNGSIGNTHSIEIPVGLDDSPNGPGRINNHNMTVQKQTSSKWLPKVKNENGYKQHANALLN